MGKPIDILGYFIYTVFRKWDCKYSTSPTVIVFSHGWTLSTGSIDIYVMININLDGGGGLNLI